jgi:hypothetical protein
MAAWDEAGGYVLDIDAYRIDEDRKEPPWPCPGVSPGLYGAGRETPPGSGGSSPG